MRFLCGCTALLVGSFALLALTPEPARSSDPPYIVGSAYSYPRPGTVYYSTPNYSGALNSNAPLPTYSSTPNYFGALNPSAPMPSYYTALSYYGTPNYSALAPNYAPRVLYYSTPPVYTLPYPTPAPPSALEATVAGITLNDEAFEPSTLQIQPGTTIRWVNRGQRVHTVTSRTDLWDSGDLDPGATYSLTLKRPGTYYYFCRHHRNMMGTIVVVGPGSGN
jgi:plastocyanin